MYVDSVVGPITIAVDGPLLHHVRFGREDGAGSAPGDGPLALAAGQLTEYFAGRRTAFDLGDLEPDWSRLEDVAARVLRTLVEIAPYGHTVSYGELTVESGLSIGESRAVGTYLNRNPWPIVVPCHRVVMTDGSLGGFGSGLWRKEELLRLEGVLSATLFD